MNEATTKTDDCFLCGSIKELKPIKRWKPLSRAVKLIDDHICPRCERRLEKKNKFKIKTYSNAG